MFVLDEHGRIVTWHLGAQHVFGYTSAEMTDQPAAPLFNMTEREFAALLEQPHDRGSRERDGVCRRRDGSRFIGTTVIRPLEDDADDLRGFVAVTRDVTERRDLEEQLRQARRWRRSASSPAASRTTSTTCSRRSSATPTGSATISPGDQTHSTQIVEIQKAAERAAGADAAAARVQPAADAAAVDHRSLAARRRIWCRCCGGVIGEHIDIVGRPRAGRCSPVLGDRSQLEQVVAEPRGQRARRDAERRHGSTIRTAERAVSTATQVARLGSRPGVVCSRSPTRASAWTPATQARDLRAVLHDEGASAAARASAWRPSTASSSRWGARSNVTSAPNQGTTFKLYFPETQSARKPSLGPVSPDSPRGFETLLLVEDDAAVRTYLTRLLEGAWLLRASPPNIRPRRSTVAGAIDGPDPPRDHRRPDAWRHGTGAGKGARPNPTGHSGPLHFGLCRRCRPSNRAVRTLGTGTSYRNPSLRPI